MKYLVFNVFVVMTALFNLVGSFPQSQEKVEHLVLEHSIENAPMDIPAPIDGAAMFNLSPVWTMVPYSVGAEGVPMMISTGDVDHDDQVEIVIATETSANASQSGAVLIYDGSTYDLEGTFIVDNPMFTVTHLDVGQLDTDDALEILIGGRKEGLTYLKVFDGITHALQWTSAYLGMYPLVGLVTQNMFGDSVEEIIYGLHLVGVKIINGAGNSTLWESGQLNGEVKDFDVGDIDGDSLMDILVLTESDVYFYGWDMGFFGSYGNRYEPWGDQLVITNQDLTGTGEYIISSTLPNGQYVLTAHPYSGSSTAPLWTHLLDNNLALKDIRALDLNQNGSQELILIGSLQENTVDTHSFLGIASNNYPFFWEYKRTVENGGFVNNVIVSDVNGDLRSEFMLAGDKNSQLNNIESSPAFIYSLYLPQLNKPLARGLYGKVTENGVPVRDLFLVLRKFNGTTWSGVASTGTEEDGSYSFPNAVTLNPGEKYHVWYIASSPNPLDPDRLYSWNTRDIDSYQAGNEVLAGNFDIANVALDLPADDATVAVPYSFKWTPRPASPTDSYKFELETLVNPRTYYYSNLLGYTGSYTLNQLPAGFTVNEKMLWLIRVYAPDGGWGYSYDWRYVTFSNTGLDNKESDGQ